MKNIFLVLLICIPLHSWAESKKQRLDLFIDSVYAHSSYRLKNIRIKKEWNAIALDKVGESFQAPCLKMSPLKKKGDIIGYVLVDKAQGKDSKFTLAIIYDVNRQIQSIDIIHDPSPHGLKLRQLNFIRQFYGRTKDSSYVIGEDIDGISGSTYSVKGLSRAVWRISTLLAPIISKK